MQEQSECGRWYRYRFGFLAIGEELDADAGPLAELVGCKAAAGLAREQSIGLARRSRLKVLPNQRQLKKSSRCESVERLSVGRTFRFFGVKERYGRFVVIGRD
jgi:hypothetical protein